MNWWVLFLGVALGALYLVAAVVLALRVRGVGPAKVTVHPKVSVLIPVRDEAENIEAALGCLARQTYPLDQLEVLVIDDGSTDATSERAKRAASGSLQVRVLKAPPREPEITGKQGALDYGLRRATGTVILTTDADVRQPPTWVDALVSRLRPDGPGLICGLALPASTARGLGRLLAWFETGELLLLQTVAAGWTGLGRPLSAFGKSLGYQHALMKDIGGYRALGFAPNEDMRLVQRAGSSGVGWASGRAATVLVLPSSGVGMLLRRRARWARYGYRSDPWLFLSTLVAFLNGLGTLVAVAAALALGNGWLAVLGGGPMALGNLLLVARGAALAGRPGLALVVVTGARGVPVLRHCAWAVGTVGAARGRLARPADGSAPLAAAARWALRKAETQARTASTPQWDVESISGRDEVRLPPILLHYYVTYRCNLRCRYCDIPLQPEPRDPVGSSLETLKAIVAQAREAGARFVDFTGGEPLLYKPLPDALAWAKELGYWTSTTTNCTLYPRRAEALRGLVDLLHFSLDSADPEAHDAQRGHGNWAQVLAALDLAERLSETPDLLFTVTQANVGAMEGMVRLAQERRLILIVNPEFTYFDGNGSLSEAQLREVARYAWEPYVYLNRAFLSLRRKGGNRVAKPRCRAVTSTIAVSPDGCLLLPCYHHHAERIPIRDNLRELLDSPAVQRAVLMQGRYDFCEGCTINCYMDPSFCYLPDSLLFESLVSKAKYGFDKYIRRRLEGWFGPHGRNGSVTSSYAPQGAEAPSREAVKA